MSTDHHDRHVVLIGLPGAGKTNLGRHLAKVLDRPFADADEHLELTVGCTISRLFRERGETDLGRLERQTLAELIARDCSLVIAAPGAVRLDDDHRALLASSAVVFWIRGSIRFLTELSDPTHRPRMTDDHEQALIRLNGELSALYADVADHIVDIEPFHALDGEPKRAIAHHIVELLGLPATGPPPADSAALERASARMAAELSARYAEVADVIVDIEPFHALDGEPERTIARHIVGKILFCSAYRKGPGL